MMRNEYDVSRSRPNPYAARLERAVTIRPDEPTIAYSKALAAETGMGYHTFNSFLRDCAAAKRRPAVRWARSKGAVISWLLIAASIMAVAPAEAQLGEDLRAAMEARDRAFYSVDAAQWEKYTASTFTTVQQDGSFMTRAERLANLRAQTPRPYVPRSRQQNERRGDIVIARFFSGGLWVLEVWSRDTGSWRVLTSQVTTAKP